METFKNYSEYVLRVFQTSDYSGQTLSMVALLLALLCVLTWYTTPWHLERAVSKRSIQARHREVQDIAAQKFTEALEQSVTSGLIKRHEADAQYEKLRTVGFKEVGPEPSFGRPWYYGPAKIPDFGMRKREIYTRLYNMGVDVHAKLSKLKRSTPPKKIDAIMSKLKASKST